MIEILRSQRKLTLLSLLTLFFFIAITVTTRGFAESYNVQRPTETKQQTVIFHTATGEHTINLEVAKTDREKTFGLMYRKELAENAGMVFIYDTPTDAGIWMKNTDLPLDVIFVDCDNNIVDFVTREPQTTDISYSPVKICKIIEVNAGLNKKITLEKGNKVNFIPPI